MQVQTPAEGTYDRDLCIPTYRSNSGSVMTVRVDGVRHWYAMPRSQGYTTWFDAREEAVSYLESH